MHRMDPDSALLHDVRGMLAPMSLTAQNLETFDDPDVARAARCLRIAIERMESFCHTRQSKPSLQNGVTDIETLVEDIADVLGPETGGEVAITTQVSGSPRIQLSEASVFRMIYNLARNAVQASRTAGGSRTVIKTSVQRGRLIVDIVDDGPGLPMKIAAWLRSKSKKAPQGLGIGLPSTAAEAAACGGSLTSVGGRRQGCLMRLSLPLSPKRPTILLNREAQAA